jgi:hypothetical protein
LTFTHPVLSKLNKVGSIHRSILRQKERWCVCVEFSKGGRSGEEKKKKFGSARGEGVERESERESVCETFFFLLFRLNR